MAFGLDMGPDSVVNIKVIGVGGGTVLDLAKFLAAEAGVPVMAVPTSAATCAASDSAKPKKIINIDTKPLTANHSLRLVNLRLQSIPIYLPSMPA